METSICVAVLCSDFYTGRCMAFMATRQRPAFSIVGPSTWNGHPLEIRLLPKNNERALCRLLTTDLYRRGWAVGAGASE